MPKSEEESTTKEQNENDTINLRVVSQVLYFVIYI